MIKEHALLIKNEITIKDLEYLVKKANKLGLKNRIVTGITAEKDFEGRHIFYTCEGFNDE